MIYECELNNYSLFRTVSSELGSITVWGFLNCLSDYQVLKVHATFNWLLKHICIFLSLLIVKKIQQLGSDIFRWKGP